MNGREFTADDVVFNFHRYLGLGDFTEAGPSTYGGAASFISIPFESVTATDKRTVVMKLKEPSLTALELILNDRAVAILPPEVIEQHGEYQGLEEPGRHRTLYGDRCRRGEQHHLDQES